MHAFKRFEVNGGRAIADSLILVSSKMIEHCICQRRSHVEIVLSVFACVLPILRHFKPQIQSTNKNRMDFLNHNKQQLQQPIEMQQKDFDRNFLLELFFLI